MKQRRPKQDITTGVWGFGRPNIHIDTSHLSDYVFLASYTDYNVLV